MSWKCAAEVYRHVPVSNLTTDSPWSYGKFTPKPLREQKPRPKGDLTDSCWPSQRPTALTAHPRARMEAADFAAHATAGGQAAAGETKN